MPYEEYFKAATEGLVIVDRGGRIVEANPEAERLFGYPLAELIGKPIELLVPAQLRENHDRHVAAYFSAPRTRVMGRGLNLAGRRKDGTEFPLEISLTYAPGTVRGDMVVAAIIDISERLALEQEVRRAETLGSLGTLAAGIAHDLNNPLQVIRSISELLLETPGVMPELREDYATIQRQAERAIRIIDEFLGLSRQREKVITRLDINALVDRTLLLIGPQIKKFGVRVETNLDRNLPEINGDAIGLERVMVNLLTNARDAMPQGGAVTITSGMLKAPEPSLLVTVTDTGSGMDSDTMSNVFKLLYTTKSSGTGLGLWLSRRIVQEHNGRIEVQSELGKGTTFKIRLPAADFPVS